MAFIVNRLLANRLQLMREDLIRPLPFGNRWSSLRIAMLLQINGASSYFSEVGLPPMLSAGVCRGTTTPIFSGDNTLDAVGYAPDYSWAAGANPVTYNSSCLLGYYTGGKVFQKIGGALTTTGVSGSGYNCWIGALSQAGNGPTETRRTPIYLDIQRATLTGISPSPYTMSMYSPYTALTCIDTDPGAFYDAVKGAMPPANAILLSTVAHPITGLFNHDCVFVTWPRFTPAIEIVELIAVRLS